MGRNRVRRGTWLAIGQRWARFRGLRGGTILDRVIRTALGRKLSGLNSASPNTFSLMVLGLVCPAVVPLSRRDPESRERGVPLISWSMLMGAIVGGIFRFSRRLIRGFFYLFFYIGRRLQARAFRKCRTASALSIGCDGMSGFGEIISKPRGRGERRRESYFQRSQP